MPTKYAKGTMRALKRISIRPYVRKIYGPKTPASGQLSFEGLERNKGFKWDFNFKVPAGAYQKTKKFYRKHNLLINVGGSGVAGYAGTRLAIPRSQRRGRR